GGRGEGGGGGVWGGGGRGGAAMGVAVGSVDGITRTSMLAPKKCTSHGDIAFDSPDHSLRSTLTKIGLRRAASVLRKRARKAPPQPRAMTLVGAGRRKVQMLESPNARGQKKRPLAAGALIVATLGLLRLRLRLPRRGGRIGAGARLAGGWPRRAARRWLDRRLAHRSFPGEQVLDLVTAERFEFEQAFGQEFHVGATLGENALRLGMTGI